jgi:HSP20 family protein
MAIPSPLHPLSRDVAEQLHERMRRILVRLDEMRAMASSPSAWMPPVDVCEMDEAILVRVELPGVSRTNVRLTMLDNMLKIEGRKEREAPNQFPEADRPIRFICLERSYGNFTFSVALNWPIEVENISAKMVDGVLQIRLPKAPTCGREIAITISE